MASEKSTLSPQRVLAVVGIFLLCAACSKAPEKPAAPAYSAQPAAMAPSLPADQQAFVQQVAAVRAAPDDQAVYKHFCDAFLKLKTFDGWRATITDAQVSAVNDSIDVTFDIGHVKLEQVVQTSDPLHTALTDLDGRQDVLISGSFPHRNGRDECAYYRGTFSIALTRVQ